MDKTALPLAKILNESEIEAPISDDVYSSEPSEAERKEKLFQVADCETQISIDPSNNLVDDFPDGGLRAWMVVVGVGFLYALLTAAYMLWIFPRLFSMFFRRN